MSINNTTQIDLQGQAASESDGHRHISGTGGQLQFVRGAYASKGGKSFICLSSTYEKRGERRSRIVLTLTPGNIVTTPRSDVMYLVTEFGIVNLKGKSVAERAKAIIAIAHPDFREGLERQAYDKPSPHRRCDNVPKPPAVRDGCVREVGLGESLRQLGGGAFFGPFQPGVERLAVETLKCCDTHPWVDEHVLDLNRPHNNRAPLAKGLKPDDERQG